LRKTSLNCLLLTSHLSCFACFITLVLQ
jgi:hypothetical protein